MKINKKNNVIKFKFNTNCAIEITSLIKIVSNKKCILNPINME